MQQLHELITQLSFRRGAFTLASGRSSSYFFDLKPTMLHPLGANLVAQAVLDIIDQFAVDAIGGLVVGAVPLVAATVTLSHAKRPLRGFYVRKEAKDHGTAQLIDGLDVAGLTVILLEDVTTTGGSLLKAATTVQAYGGYVHSAVTVVDRQEGGSSNLEHYGIKLRSIFTLEDFAESQDLLDRAYAIGR